MTKDMMFFCIPQQAYMATSNCTTLRRRPVGNKVPAGSQPKLRACETCSMYPLVDKQKVPMVTLSAYLGGSRPIEVNLKSAGMRKIIDDNLERQAV